MRIRRILINSPSNAVHMCRVVCERGNEVGKNNNMQAFASHTHTCSYLAMPHNNEHGMDIKRAILECAVVHLMQISNFKFHSKRSFFYAKI
jgi:hypothetical protein